MKALKITLLGLLSASLCLTTSCADSNKEKSKTETETTQTEETTETIPETNIYYAWVDNVNVRERADSQAPVIGTYKKTEPLTYANETSDMNEIIVLRGVAYDEPWIKVTTPDGKEGWVFGGTIAKEGETKGNAIMTDDKFSYPHFGTYDLSKWKNLGVRKEEGGDAETNTYSFTKNNQRLEIVKTSVGEYGYHHTYRLKNDKDKLLKERKFAVTLGDSDNFLPIKLTETVTDYKKNPAVQFERAQLVKKHYMQLNAYPAMANGEWTQTTLSDDKTAFIHPLQIITDITKLPQSVKTTDNCSCRFRIYEDDYHSIVAFGTLEDAPKAKTAIKIDGKYIILNNKKPINPDNKRGDSHWHFYNDMYDLKITATQQGDDDGGGVEYAGTMKLLKKDGTQLLDINIFGDCGC